MERREWLLRHAPGTLPISPLLNIEVHMIYHYHPVTCELLSSSGAIADPLDPSNIIIPAHSTTIKPPVTAVNQASVFGGDTWSVQDDYRGYKYWLADGSAHEITDLGEASPADALDAAPPPVLAEVQAAACNEIDAHAGATRSKYITVVPGQAEPIW